MASGGHEGRGGGRGNSRVPPALDQQAFIEAIGMAAAMIVQACGMVSQGGSNDLHRLESHHPPMVRGGVDSRVRTIMTTKGEVDVMRGIQCHTPTPYYRQVCRPLHRNPQPLPLTTRKSCEAKPYCLLQSRINFFFFSKLMIL